MDARNDAPRKTRIAFTVLGEPCGKARPKFSTQGGFTRAITPKQTVNYETLVQMEYEAQCRGHFFPPDATLCMKITAYKPIPKSTSKRKATQMLDGIVRPGKKPDFDNIGKIISDALNGVAFRDDALIVDGRVIKRYAERPRVEVEIWEEGINA